MKTSSDIPCFLGVTVVVVTLIKPNNIFSETAIKFKLQCVQALWYFRTQFDDPKFIWGILKSFTKTYLIPINAITFAKQCFFNGKELAMYKNEISRLCNIKKNIHFPSESSLVQIGMQIDLVM